MPRLLAKPPHSTLTGFTLVEIAVVVTVIGILATLAIPYVRQAKETAIISTLENDLRIFSQSFVEYEFKFRTYPPTQNTAGAYPSGMEGRLSHAWLEAPVIGGSYSWVFSGGAEDQYAYIEISTDSSAPLLIDSSRLIEIDEDIDDGNTSTGRLRVNGLNIRYYVEQ